MSSHVLSRSEKKALDDLELRNWMKQENETHWMNIDLIYHEVILQWYFNPENRNNKKIYEYPKCDISIYMRSTLTNQPRWKPTFKDIEDGLSNHLRGKLLDIMNFQNSFEIDSMYREVEICHIEHLKNICDEFEYYYEKNQPLSDFERKNYSDKGIVLLKQIYLSQQELHESDYIELCNLFRELI